MLDMDPQATAERGIRTVKPSGPNLLASRPRDLSDAVKGAARERYEFVLIDTPGRDEPATAAAIRAADFCIVPCRPTPGDMKATPATIGTIKRLGKHAAFVLTQTPPRGARILRRTKG